MSTYLGNSALSAAVKERVTSTFDQILALYRQGRTDEALAGCNLILQMDPMFDPARKLLEKVRNPNAPIDVDTLSGSASDGDALAEAKAAMAARDFERVIHLTTEILTNDLLNEEARILGDQAREKMEAAPFVEQFVKKCDQHIAAGNLDAARADLEKARALDPDHPEVHRIEGQLAGGAATAGSGFDAPSFAESAPAAAFGFEAPSFGDAPAAPSFVVDTPASSSRPAAQASDFGFTFEEEQSPAAAAPSSAFSFDTPAPAEPFAGFSFGGGAASTGLPPKDVMSGEFDFSTASMETSPEDRQKIDQYLAEGDRAFDAGDYQQAIDLWSRIFLIDVTNEQASERIEKAKAKRREIENRAEPLLAAAVAAWEKRDFAAARAKFEEVLAIDPGNTTAKDYIDRLSETVTEGGAEAIEVPFVPPPPAPEQVYEDDSIGFEAPAPVAPAPVPKRPAARPAAAPKAKKQIPMAAIAAVLGVLVLAGGGWFVWSKFLNEPDSDPAATQAIFQEASVLTRQGKFDQAISVLQNIKPDDPQHEKALVMIADLQQKKKQAAETIDGKPAAIFYQEQLAAGQAAFQASDYDGAKRAFEQAMRARPLPPDVRAMYDTAAQQVSKLDSARALFAERRFQDALTNLEALAAQDPANRNIARMITDAHFNLGAVALQEERLEDAIREFDAVLKADPNDELAKRSRDLADRYNGQPKDLLYRIYVKYLPLRQQPKA